MKKKIRDLTIQEILDMHDDEDFEGCDSCPFENTILCSVIHDKHQREYLDKEVEIKEMKGLDVIDILKPYFKGAILDGDFHFRFTPEQEKDIKEWLNG